MSLDDPTDIEGVLPVEITPGPLRKDTTRSNAATGASAAGVRAFTAQAVAFYFRAPVKAFFRTRVDYLVRMRALVYEDYHLLEMQAYAKSINPRAQSGKFSWHTTTPGLLAHAVRTYGWRFIPDQVLPPLFANVAVGAVLYTSYLQILGALHEPSSQSARRIFPPPPPSATFTAGLAAGGIQSLVAAPLDALQVRFDSRGPQYQNKTMWAYGKGKLQEIGPKGIFAGWGLSFLRDSLGSGLFFMTFETVKSQAYLKFVTTYYGSLEPWAVHNLSLDRGKPGSAENRTPVIKPHYALEPGFLMVAGVAASVAQQTVLYPLGKIQTLHYERLEWLDQQAEKPKQSHSRGRMIRAYYHAYQQTWQQCKVQAASTGSIQRWLFRGFWWTTLKNVPSTSAGLVIFELVRSSWGVGDEVRISEDGYDILLS
jgi:hypothetical protein